jgi:putative CocE/NonD family hydrolase
MRVLLALPLLVLMVAGCLGGGTGETPPVAPARATVPGQGLDRSMLSQDAYAILAPFHEYVPATVDNILLHVRVFLPDGPGPWPTILENSPYHILDGCVDSPQPLPATPVACDAYGLSTNYVPKGYAVVFADVRGTGESEGCMDMMGAKEQQDTYDLVEWIAAQAWSDGNVGMQGVSYVGTTPHEALIMAPPHLKAVATVAGVTNQWRNMFQNGVPYQGRFYPLTYEALVGLPPPRDVERGPAWAFNAANGACDQEEMVEHVRPGVYEKGLYDDYWAERNLTAHARNVTLPLLYSQGFIDRAVNPMEAIHWFNDVRGPKKAFLHQDGHQYVDRADYFETELAWFDRYLKGIDNGVDRMPIVEVLTNTDKIRLDDEWPPTDADALAFHLGPGALSTEAPADASEDYYAPLAANPAGGLNPSLETVVGMVGGAPTQLVYRSEPLASDLYVSGNAVMHLRAASDQANTYFLFDLMDEWPSGARTFVAEGWFNAHLREGFDRSAPLVPGTPYDFRFKFEPRDYILQAGHRIVLELHGIEPSVYPFDTPAATNTVLYGVEGSWLELPVLHKPVLFDRTESTGPA